MSAGIAVSAYRWAVYVNSGTEEMKYREPPLLEAVEGRRLKLGDEHPHTLESWNNLIELYETSGKPNSGRAKQDKVCSCGRKRG